MRPPVFLSLGSNLGDRERALEDALRLLGARGFRATALSSLWLTEPVGGPPQGWYLNRVVRGETDLPPEGLLDAALATERELGRVRGERNAPRTIDVDLLFYGDERRQDERLTLPHPRLPERRFVLVPLAEIAPGFRHPGLGLTVAELLARCPDASVVQPWAAAGVSR
jgi:2-amino-4-hydroxy-6-hydroxymethyldihydropteridine diphosphokinase